MYIYKLYLNDFQNFQTGEKEFNDDMDIIHSDTLFSAIINCFALIYGKAAVEEFIGEFRKRHIMVSSMFYFLDVIKNRKINSIYFLPIPFLRYLSSLPKNDIYDFKFISFKLFSELICNFDSEKESSQLNSNFNIISEEFLCSDSELPPNMNLNLKMKVIESKISLNQSRAQTSNLRSFLEESILLNPQKYSDYVKNLGMFFLAEIKSTQVDRFNSSLRLLCDEGIGGKKSFGKGVFSHFVTEEFIYDYKLFNEAGCKINLSLFSPNSNELKTLNNSIMRYLSIVRGGWTPNNIKTKDIRMIKEGSVFNKKLKGHLVNITPQKFTDHKIYRNGTGFFL